MASVTTLCTVSDTSKSHVSTVSLDLSSCTSSDVETLNCDHNAGLGDEHPRYWPAWKKIQVTVQPCVMVFPIFFGSSVFSTATAATSQEFGTSKTVMALAVSVFVAGFVFGPIVWGPASEVYGRKFPLVIGFTLFTIANIPCALAPDLPTLLVFRFLCGAFGGAPTSIVSGMYADFLDPVARGIAIMVWAAVGFTAPCLGPIVGPVIVDKLGWRWTVWVVLIIASVLLLSLPFLPETSEPTILRNKPRKKSCTCPATSSPARKISIEKVLIKPYKMLFTDPILMVMTSFNTIVYGLQYFTYFAIPYAFDVERTGMSHTWAFVALISGCLLGCAIMIWDTMVRFQRRLQLARSFVPEDRLPPMIIGSGVLFLGLLLFSLLSSADLHPAPQILSCVLIGCGMYLVWMTSFCYIGDVYLQKANSAMAANFSVRSIVASAFPVFVLPMY